MSGDWSWFCMHCLESHVTTACPISSDFNTPFLHEADPIETVRPVVTNVRLPSPHKVTNELLQSLIEAITEQTKAITLLAESNQMLIQAMAEGEGVEEADRYQTL